MFSRNHTRYYWAFYILNDAYWTGDKSSPRDFYWDIILNWGILRIWGEFRGLRRLWPIHGDRRIGFVLVFGVLKSNNQFNANIIRLSAFGPTEIKTAITDSLPAIYSPLSNIFARHGTHDGSKVRQIYTRRLPNPVLMPNKYRLSPVNLYFPICIGKSRYWHLVSVRVFNIKVKSHVVFLKKSNNEVPSHFPS